MITHFPVVNHCSYHASLVHHVTHFLTRNKTKAPFSYTTNALIIDRKGLMPIVNKKLYIWGGFVIKCVQYSNKWFLFSAIVVDVMQ